jgi:hypothetical protein
MVCAYCYGTGSVFQGGGMGRDPADGYMADYVPCDHCGGEGVISDSLDEGGPEPEDQSDYEPPPQM